MNTKIISLIIALAALGTTFSAQAHDPKEHMKDAEKPDCEAMENMDHNTMDMNDPVTQAMMKQCRQDMHHDETEKDEEQSEHKADEGQSDRQADEESPDDQHSEHQHGST